MPAELVSITVTLVHETEKAYLVNDGVKEVWLPKASCELELDKSKKFYILTLSEALAIEKELI
jgi:hypothetical protein